MPGEARRYAHADRQAGEDRAIARAPSNDDIGAAVESAQERLLTHHADDTLGAIDHRTVELGCGLERPDAAFREPALEITLVLLGMDQRQAKGQALFPRNLKNDFANGL